MLFQWQHRFVVLLPSVCFIRSLNKLFWTPTVLQEFLSMLKIQWWSRWKLSLLSLNWECMIWKYRTVNKKWQYSSLHVPSEVNKILKALWWLIFLLMLSWESCLEMLNVKNVLIFLKTEYAIKHTESKVNKGDWKITITSLTCWRQGQRKDYY